MALTFCTNVAKSFEVKRQKVLEANFYVCRNYRGKLAGSERTFLAPPILNMDKTLADLIRQSFFHCFSFSAISYTFFFTLFNPFYTCYTK